MSTCMPPRRPGRPSLSVIRRSPKSVDGLELMVEGVIRKYSVFSVQLLWENYGVKRGRRILLIVAACGVLAVVAALFWPSGEREPEYQGKKLSWWIRGATQISVRAPPGNLERAEAVRKIGTNALPFLVKWIDFGSPPKVSKIVVAIGR